MAQQEGVVKFELKFSAGAPLDIEQHLELNAWRKMLYLTQLIGQDAGRYEGYGYGNISQRVEPFDAPEPLRRFVITGTQTGGLTALSGAHYALVTECRPELNLIAAEGAIKPSSESLTHGTLYALDDTLRFVMHAHSPHIWRYASRLDIPCTRASVPYGTPEMAEEVRRLFRETSVSAKRIFSMAGHQEGVITFGQTAEEAGEVMLKTLARAFRFDNFAL